MSIVILRLLLVMAMVAGFGLLVMSLEANSASGQWILPSSDLDNAYKRGYHESNATIGEKEIKQK